MHLGSEKRVTQIFIFDLKYCIEYYSHIKLLNYVELRKAIEKLKTLKDCGIHNWDECLRAVIKEESVESLMEDEKLFFDEKKIEEVRSFIITREENIYIEVLSF